MNKVDSLISEISEIQSCGGANKEGDWLSILLDLEFIKSELLKISPSQDEE